ncbi:hypothetical protein HDU96_003339 [Phlyctochytrium bullatum]|nr:hypothetical protein HDU96_003339 [Phlyctochytrium bullatum]
MTNATPQQSPLIDLRHVDVKVIIDVCKVLTHHLDPDFATLPEGTSADNGPQPDLPFGLTITTPMHRQATLALLKTAVSNSSSNVEPAHSSNSSSSVEPVRSLRDGLPPPYASNAAQIVTVSSQPRVAPRASDTSPSLHEAARRNDVKTVETLLAAGVDPYQKDASGRIPIELSTSLSVWRLFVPKMFVLKMHQFSDAIEHGDAVGVKLLIASGADSATHNIDRTGVPAIHLAVMNGHEDVLCALLDSSGVKGTC